MLFQNIAILSTLFSPAASQAAQGGGAPGGNPTGSIVTTTTYLNGPTVPPPNLVQGPWTDADHLEGTWSSKSMMVMTGPDFFDPVDELLIEPALPGISFSFTKDGFFETAQYQISPNPKNSSCSTAALTFQHGSYKITDDGKLKMTPIEDDGRQLVSDPCNSNMSEYVQYDQTLTMKEFAVSIDLYYGRYSLQLYQWDGTPLPPLYLVYRPPQMLPTETLTPGVKNITKEFNNKKKREAKYNMRDRIKRSLINRSRTSAVRDDTKPPLYNTIWWGGISMMLVGGATYAYLS